MSWQTVLNFDPGKDRPLGEQINALFAQQRATWPALSDGEAALDHLHRKKLHVGEDAIIVQLNPARRASTTAKTDARSLAARPCFLCPENMPPEERGVSFEDLVVMPNPFPILRMHCTIAARGHRPQQLSGNVDTFLRLARELGPTMAVFYNGPKCGASAPDHFHFQAAPAAEIPILAQSPSFAQGEVTVHSSFGRTLICYTGSDPHRLQAQLERSIDALGTIEQSVEEPMLNLLGHWRDGYRIVLYPRTAHRPARYFSSGPDRLAVSPAVLEMSGIMVTTELADFERIDAPTARAIYAEVSVAQDLAHQLVTRFG